MRRALEVDMESDSHEISYSAYVNTCGLSSRAFVQLHTTAASINGDGTNSFAEVAVTMRDLFAYSGFLIYTIRVV